MLLLPVGAQDEKQMFGPLQLIFHPTHTGDMMRNNIKDNYMRVIVT